MTRALIVAHGQPSDPASQEAALQRLAGAVAALVPGLEVRGATLAAPGALDAACAGATDPIIYPFFMAGGWFTQRELPRRLASAGATGARLLAPFGTERDLPSLMEDVLEGADRVLLAGHGSGRSQTSTDTLEAAAACLRASGHYGRVATGYLEQAPWLAEAARDMGHGTCLPFFALRADHVTGDLPAALAEAGFDGPLLAPIGEHPAVPALIAASLRGAA